MALSTGTVVDVYADIWCPFAYVGIKRFLAARDERGRDDVALRVRAWPLELVNGEPLDRHKVAEEVVALRDSVAGDLLATCAVDRLVEHFPGTTLPALALVEAAYAKDVATGTAVSVEVRDRLFLGAEDVELVEVLAEVAAGHGIASPVVSPDTTAVLDEYERGRRRGVIGSPHFFLPAAGDPGYFCPALSIRHSDAEGFVVTVQEEQFHAFLDVVFG